MRSVDSSAAPVSHSSEAIAAFDGVAPTFDARFDRWRSVTAQRAAVRRYLLAAFPPGSTTLELGGGTGTDAIFLARHGRSIVLTDGAPEMLRRAAHKVDEAGCGDRVTLRRMPIEDLATMAPPAGAAQFDGVYSNFAAFNCVADLAPVVSALARLVRPKGAVVVVVFGRWCLGEWVLHLARGDARTAFRRLQRGPVQARINGHPFDVRYWSIRDMTRVFAPQFRLRRVRGIGIGVPPSAAEPQISRYPRFLRVLQVIDRLAAAPLAPFGDHVLLHFERTAAVGRGHDDV